MAPMPRVERPPILSVVVPLFDERESLAELHRRTVAVLNRLADHFEILLVDDGSRDDTAARIDALAGSDSRVRPIHLSRNFGHQAAISAGIDHARGDAVIVLDGDLQDPPEVIPRLVELWRAGHDVVYAVRSDRKEGPLKRAGYWAFYRLMRALSDIEIPLDSGDFCLMDRRVVEVLRHLPERLRFLRGLRSFAGFRQVGLRYERAARADGQSKYSTQALVRLAIDGLVSFSSYPLRLVTYLGIASAGLAMALTAWVVVDAIASGASPRGWASTIIVVLFMGATQLVSLGIIGEYVRRIFLETKGRPTYIVAREGPPEPRRFDLPDPNVAQPHVRRLEDEKDLLRVVRDIPIR